MRFCCTACKEEHRSRETVLGTRLSNGAFMQKASCRKWHELSAHRRGIFYLSPNPFHKHMFLTCACLQVLGGTFGADPPSKRDVHAKSLVSKTTRPLHGGYLCGCNEMLAPCGDARQQVRSKAEFAHPCVESFVPSRKQDVSKCLAHVVC